MIGMLQAIETLVGDANQLIGLFAVLWERSHTVVYGHIDAERQSLQRFGKNRFDTPAQRKRLFGIGLRQQHRKFVAADAKRRV